MASTDPRVHALAARTCGDSRLAVAACTSLSARRWAALDPANGVPWLAVLTEARRLGDEPGQREALARMAAATRWHSGLFDAAALVSEQLPSDDASSAANDGLAMQAYYRSMDVGATSALVDICRDKAGGDTDRAQQCATIGRLMADRADTLIDRMTGGAVFMRATGDPSLRDAFRADYRRLSGQLKAVGDAPVTPDGSTCGAVREPGRRFRREAEIGELAAMRELVAAAVAASAPH